MASGSASNLTNAEMMELQYLRQQEYQRRHGLRQVYNPTGMSGQPYFPNQQPPNHAATTQAAFIDPYYNQQAPRGLIYAHQRPSQSQSHRTSGPLHDTYLQNATVPHAQSSGFRFQAAQGGYMRGSEEFSTHIPQHYQLIAPPHAVVFGEGPGTSSRTRVPGHDKIAIQGGKPATSQLDDFATPQCLHCGRYYGGGIHWIYSVAHPGKILCDECVPYEREYSRSKVLSAPLANGKRFPKYLCIMKVFVEAKPLLCSPPDGTVFNRTPRVRFATPVESAAQERTSSPNMESSPCPPHAKSRAYISHSTSIPVDRNPKHPSGAIFKVHPQPPTVRRDARTPLLQGRDQEGQNGASLTWVPPWASENKRLDLRPQSKSFPSLTSSNPKSSTSLNHVTPIAFKLEVADTLPLHVHSIPPFHSIKTDGPQQPTRKDAQSLPGPSHSRPKPSTRLKLVDLLNADVKVKTEISTTPINHSASKRTAEAQLTPAYLTPSNLEDLNRIWTADPRVPTVQSRKAWAAARGIAQVRVSHWFSRKRARVLRSGAELGEGSYELSVDAPGPRAIAVKQEAIVEESVPEEKTAPRKSKMLARVQGTVSKSAPKEEFHEPPALRTRSKRQVLAVDTRLSSTRPKHPTTGNPSAVASTRSTDPPRSHHKRKLAPAENSAVAEPSPSQKPAKRRKICASKSVSTHAKSQVVTKQAASKRASSKVTPKNDHPRPLRDTQKSRFASSQKFSTPADDVSLAQLLATGTKQSGSISSEERTAADLLPDSLYPCPELPRYLTADIKFVPSSDHWEDLCSDSVLLRWETTALMECLAIPATSDTNWQACLSEEAFQDERLLPTDHPWDMEGIEDMEFTSEQLKEIVKLNEEMRDEP